MANATGMTDEEVRQFLNSFFRTVSTMRYWQKMFYSVKYGDKNKGYYLQQSKVFEFQTDELITSIENRLNHKQ